MGISAQVERKSQVIKFCGSKQKHGYGSNKNMDIHALKDVIEYFR
jgi:hypothetical protein